MSSHRCGGHCCKSFTFPFSPEELKRLRESVNNGTNTFINDLGVENSHRYEKAEIIKISDMLIFQEFNDYDPQLDRKYKVEPEADDMRKSRLHSRGFIVQESGQLMTYKYTCKHFNVEQAICMNYEDRPNMCKIFPNIDGCAYKQCQGSCSVANIEKESKEKGMDKLLLPYLKEECEGGKKATE
jgi:Fe-S-cluster containining protein